MTDTKLIEAVQIAVANVSKHCTEITPEQAQAAIAAVIAHATSAESVDEIYSRVRREMFITLHRDDITFILTAALFGGE
jgi:predicted RNA polymerase sigma factor